MSTVQLFKTIESVIDLPSHEMPRMQKLRALNLCRVWCESYLYKRPKDGPVQLAFSNLVKSCQKSQDREIMDFGEELKVAYEVKDLNLAPSPRALGVSETIQKILTGNSTTEEFNNFIDLISLDLKSLAALRVFDSSPSDFMQESKISEKNLLNTFHNSLVAYVKSYAAQVQVLQDSRNSEMTLNFVHLFLSLCQALIDKNDYFSSFSIFNALNIDKIISELKESKKERIFSVKRFSMDRDIAEEIVNIFEKTSLLFKASNNFGNLKKQIEKCRANKLFFIPEITIVCSKVIHDLETIQNSMKKASQLDVFFSLAESDLVSWLNDLFQEVRFHVIKELTRQPFYTDIGLEIFKNDAKLSLLPKNAI